MAFNGFGWFCNGFQNALWLKVWVPALATQSVIGTDAQRYWEDPSVIGILMIRIFILVDL